MTTDNPQTAPRHPLLRTLMHKDVLAGVLFIGIAALGLWISRNYPVGTALRMSTGYVPRLLCWLLIGLGALVLGQGLRNARNDDQCESTAPFALKSALIVTASLVAFGLTLERLGVALAILTMVAIASLAARDLKAWEAAAAAAGLIVLSWTIFIAGLGLTIPIWPDW
jgi:hypothetical protein